MRKDKPQHKRPYEKPAVKKVDRLVEVAEGNGPTAPSGITEVPGTP
jgi:hypothetical protein